MLASGMTEDEILQDYPYLEKADFPASTPMPLSLDGNAQRVEASLRRQSFAEAVALLAELFPESTHVFDTGMARFTPDESVWAYAGLNGFSIVTADADFLRLLEERGAPPKVIHLEKCDYKTRIVEELLRPNAVWITGMNDANRDYLIIRKAK